MTPYSNTTFANKVPDQPWDEAPPGLLFSRFKEAIVEGRASETDVSFYFVHWLTDLAGAEAFDMGPWPGSEKFTVKFPMKVLQAFLDSFGFIDHLATSSEVETMERYLKGRWAALGPPTKSIVRGGEVAAMRIALMAQGFEKEAITAFEELPAEKRDILLMELARTGTKMSFELAPDVLRDAPAGPTLFIYYGPALLQKAGAAHIADALSLLAAVFHAARKLFPLEPNSTGAEIVVTIRIDKLKIATLPELVQQGPWYIQRTGRLDAEATRTVLPVKDEHQGNKVENALDIMRIQWPLSGGAFTSL